MLFDVCTAAQFLSRDKVATVLHGERKQTQKNAREIQMKRTTSLLSLCSVNPLYLLRALRCEQHEPLSPQQRFSIRQLRFNPAANSSSLSIFCFLFPLTAPRSSRPAADSLKVCSAFLICNEPVQDNVCEMPPGEIY